MSERTTAELERDAEAARARVADTAESIRSKMTPGQMIDEFTGLFTGGDGSIALSNLKSQVRDNPLPLTLIGAGLAWLVMGQGPAAQATTSSRRSTLSADGGYSSYDDAEGGTVADRTADVAAGLKSTIGSTVSAIGDMVADAAHSAASVAGNSTNRLSETVAGSKDWMGGVTRDAKSGAGELAGKARQSASDLFESEPLIVAALGLAVGTAIGAMLPSTMIEDENLGALSDKIRGQAKEAVERGVDAAKEVAAETYETVKEEADRVGSSGDGSIVDRIAEVTRATSARTESVLRDKISPQGD